MNSLNDEKIIQKMTIKEQAMGIINEGSWHAKYKDLTYIYVRGLHFDLTEGDVGAVFSQCGEIVDVNLVRDKATGKSKGFAFLAYKDESSSLLAMKNLNGTQIVGSRIEVDYIGDCKKLEKEEVENQWNKEKRGVCCKCSRGMHFK